MNFTSTEALLDWFDRSDGVTTDTRRCGPGKLFFALKGERFDGNAFATRPSPPAASPPWWTMRRGDRLFT